MSRRHSPRVRVACTTPWKVSLISRERAEQRIAEINSTATHHTKTPQRAYLCACGTWHLTSKE
jgi:hypothetical protein